MIQCNRNNDKRGEKFQGNGNPTNLPKEYISLLQVIGGELGIPLETLDSMASRISRANGMPLIKILVGGIENLPNNINLPTSGGSFLHQRVEYKGLPNQCFDCRGMGHIARNCPHAHKKTKVDNSQPLHAHENGPKEFQQWRKVTIKRKKKKDGGWSLESLEILLQNIFESLDQEKIDGNPTNGELSGSGEYAKDNMNSLNGDN